LKILKSTAKKSVSAFDWPDFTFSSLGWIETCYREKFAIPRQPGLVPHSWGKIHLKKNGRYLNAIKGLESFSHLWLIFVFHDTGTDRWVESVRPPRMGGVKKIGVLATRSPHRPNPIGISVVQLKEIEVQSREILIHVRSVDLLSGTPILDIKPYLPYADSLMDAKSGWADEPIKRHTVVWSEAALSQVYRITEYPDMKLLIEELVSLDMRPAFQIRKLKSGRYGFSLMDYDVRYEILNPGENDDCIFKILEIVPL
jgi:tRNA-Thr(GGU) m(6)t(6)A37 methyltransferase TsaA